MKEIIFVTPNITNGGAERVTAVLANELTHLDEKVMLCLMKDSEIMYPIEEDVNILPLFAEKGGKYTRIFKKIFRLRKLIKGCPDAVVVAMIPYETVYSYIACIGLKNRKVYSLRNDPKSMNSLIDKIINKYIYKEADMVVFQTETARDFFSEKVRKHSCVIPNPISADLPMPYAGKRKKEIVSVGRLNPQKNYPMLLSAFASVHQKHSDWILKIYGQGNLLEDLKELCRTLGIADAVQFCGFVTNVPEKIMQSGLFVMASDYEGISNAMLEAMALGLPCICTDCPAGGAGMMINNYENGILVPVGDERRLTEAILEVIENSELAKTLSEEAVKIRERLSAKIIAEKWRRVL
ncbi:MAG: glycosyltransferase [Muricoprocola sp.]